MKNIAKISVFALFVAVMTVACNNAPKTDESTSATSTSTDAAAATAQPTTPDTAHAAQAATPDTTKK